MSLVPESKFPPKIALIIGNKNYSSWSLRPWLALEASRIPFSEVLIPLDHANTRAQILQYSPTGRVPVLKYGNLTIWESLAIIEYAADTYPDAGVWPIDQQARAIARALSAEIHAGFAAFRAACPMNLRRRSRIAISQEVEAEVKRICDYWKKFGGYFTEDGPYLFGKFSAVDAMFAPLASRIRSYEIPVDRTSNTYIDAIYDHPAFRKWFDAALLEPWRIRETDEIDGLRTGR